MKEEKKTKDAKRAKRQAEISAVHKKAREVRGESKNFNAMLRFRKQCNVDMKTADL